MSGKIAYSKGSKLVGTGINYETSATTSPISATIAVQDRTSINAPSSTAVSGNMGYITFTTLPKVVLLVGYADGTLYVFPRVGYMVHSEGGNLVTMNSYIGSSNRYRYSTHSYSSSFYYTREVYFSSDFKTFYFYGTARYDSTAYMPTNITYYY